MRRRSSRSVDDKLKKSRYFPKLNNNLSWIGYLTILGFLLTPVAIARCLTNTASDIPTTVLFQPPPGEEQPENTEGAASRQNGKCFSDSIPSQSSKFNRDRSNLTAVVPDRNYGLTTAERPTFWVYLPQTSAQQAILSIREEGINPYWQQSIDLTKKTGMIGIKLSDNAPALEINQNYQWAVILICNNKPHPNDPVVAAWIKRIDESQIGRDGFPPIATELEKAAWYAQQGIWYDALDILVEERSSLPNWNDIWFKYLQSGGLDEIADLPVISH